MDKKLKAKWVKALLSGDFKQGRGQLERDGAHCCLGVLGEVTGLDYEGTNGFLYRDAEAEALAVLGPEKQRALAWLNDAGVPFEVIAGFINENL